MVEKIKVGGRKIGEGEPVFIISEIGQNHNGNLDLAKTLIDQAARDKVDAVKFCKRHIPFELTKEKYHQPYLGPNSFGETYGKHRDFLEFSKEQHQELMEYARKKGLMYFASVCDPKSAEDMDEIGVEMFKVASRDLTNKPLIEHLAKKGKPIFLSTGMSNLEDVRRTVSLIKRSHSEILLFHCTSSYPSKYEEVNLLGLNSLKKEFNLNVGMSDHTVGIMVPCAAAAMGAVAVEKHVTLSRYMKGTDHIGALDPPGMERLVTWIRNFERAKGSPNKAILNSEFLAKQKLARSIVAFRDLKKGDILTKDMIFAKTHTQMGMNPFDEDLILGKRLSRDISEDDLILPSDVTEVNNLE